MSANTKIENLSDYFRVARNLEVRCGCGHRSVVDGEKLARWFFIHLWDTRKHLIRDHLRCTRCGNRPSEIRPASNAPTAPDRFPRDEAAWKRAVARLRG